MKVFDMVKKNNIGQSASKHPIFRMKDQRLSLGDIKITLGVRRNRYAWVKFP
jgi:hypothetical protein